MRTQEKPNVFTYQDNSVKIPKPTLRFEGLDNISIVGERNIEISELFELHLKLENYLKLTSQAVINNGGSIVGYKKTKL